MIKEFYYKRKEKLEKAFWLLLLTIAITIIIACALFILYGAWLWLESWWTSQGIIWFTAGYKTTREYYKKVKFWKVN